MKKKLLIGLVTALFLVEMIGVASAAPVLQTTDFISEAQRSNLVTFDLLSSSSSNSPLYFEDGVRVEQIGGDGDDISALCGTGFCWVDNDTFNWYPNGGDFGFTEISRIAGTDFAGFGVDLGTGAFLSSSSTLSYNLLDNGISVLSGTINYLADGYIGFSGGNFDTVQLSATQSGFGSRNVLAIDNIELTAVPLPAAVWLFGSALIGLASIRKSKKNIK